MKLTVTIDGKPVAVEVDLGAGTVRLAGREHGFTVVRRDPTRVELEVDGEKVEVAGWPEGLASPEPTVDVLGERLRASVRVEAGSVAEPVAAVPARPPADGPSADGPGTAVRPPMPGKVLELRVREGDRVRRGDILLVLEAMKMRNEIASPADGIVQGLRVAAGANVRGREPLLRIVPAAD